MITQKPFIGGIHLENRFKIILYFEYCWRSRTKFNPRYKSKGMHWCAHFKNHFFQKPRQKYFEKTTIKIHDVYFSTTDENRQKWFNTEWRDKREIYTNAIRSLNFDKTHVSRKLVFQTKDITNI